MSPEQILEAHPLCVKLDGMVRQRNLFSTAENPPCEAEDSGGNMNITGFGGGIYYLKDEEYSQIKAVCLKILDDRIEKMKQRLAELGVEI